MSATPSGAAELLERSLAYARGALRQVTPSDLRRRTPCADWTLDALLVHLDDALDAFIDGAAGWVSLAPSAAVETRVAVLQAKACALLGAWPALLAHDAPPPPVRIGDGRTALSLGVSLVARAAALEIAGHGWDVGRATGRGAPLPTGLAAALLPVAVELVDPSDRGVGFGPPLRVDPHSAADVRLLGFLGRPGGEVTDLTGPAATDSLVRVTQARPAS